eukprot:1373560-Rhodomonas_salina.2
MCPHMHRHRALEAWRSMAAEMVWPGKPVPVPDKSVPSWTRVAGIIGRLGHGAPAENSSASVQILPECRPWRPENAGQHDIKAAPSLHSAAHLPGRGRAGGSIPVGHERPSPRGAARLGVAAGRVGGFGAVCQWDADVARRQQLQRDLPSAWMATASGRTLHWQACTGTARSSSAAALPARNRFQTRSSESAAPSSSAPTSSPSTSSWRASRPSRRPASSSRRICTFRATGAVLGTAAPGCCCA